MPATPGPAARAPATPTKRPLPEEPWKATPFMHKLSSNPDKNKKITVAVMKTFLKDELGDSRLVNIPGLVEHLFPTERLALSVNTALRALLQAKKLVTRDGVVTWNTDLKFLGGHDSQGTSEAKLKDFLTEISSALRDACPNCPETVRRWSTVAASRSLKDGPADRKPDIILSSAKDEDLTNADVLSVVQLKSNPNQSTQALEQVLHNCFAAFSTQTHRRFMVSVTFCENLFRVYHVDRSGLLGSIAFDITQDIQTFVRLLIGLTLCPATSIGKDLTVFAKDGWHLCVEVAGFTYLLLECVFQSEGIRGRGTVCWRAVRLGDDTGTQYAIKDTWSDTSRESEKEIMEKLKGIKGLATLVAAEKVNNGDGMDTTDYIRSILSPSWRQNIEVRQLWRIVTTPFGEKLSMFSSKGELLSALIDAIRTHQEMLETKNRLHRDISYGNVMMHPAGGNLNPESSNDALPPKFREGLLIDVDYSIDVKAFPRKLAVGHRTGTLPFMAVNVLLGREHKPHHDLESFFYVLVWICTFYEGPNNSPRKDITAAAVEWTGIGILDSYKTFASRKIMAFRSDELNFQDEVLHFVTPYFNDLRPCLSDLQDCFNNQVPPTHTKMIGILRHHMNTLPDKDHKVDKPSTGTGKDVRDSTRELGEPQAVPYLKKIVVPRPRSSHVMVTRSQVARSASDRGIASSLSTETRHAQTA